MTPRMTPGVPALFLLLQVLATVHGAERGRQRKPRNVLRILSTNTRRTKVRRTQRAPPGGGGLP